MKNRVDLSSKEVSTLTALKASQSQEISSKSKAIEDKEQEHKKAVENLNTQLAAKLAEIALKSKMTEDTSSEL